MIESNKILLVGIIIIFVALIITGLKGWNNLVVPNLGKLSQFSLSLLLGFSFLAGLVSFFSPCAFALFPGYIAFYLGSGNGKGKKESPSKLGIMASLGVISFFLFLSFIIMVIGKSITRYLGFLAPSVGAVIFLLGLVLFLGYSFKTPLLQGVIERFRTKETRTKGNIYLFGVGYGALSLGCTFPLLFALVIMPLTSGKIFTVFLSLLVYALAMSVLMVGVTYLVAFSEERIIRKMVSSTGTIKKLSGVALIIIGAYLLYYNIFYGMLW